MRSERLYLVDIVEACEAIQRFIDNRSMNEFLADDYFQSAVINKFGIIGVSAGKLSSELRDRYPEVQWKEARRFRNVVVHAYFSIDWEIVWIAAMEDVPRLRKQVDAILEAEFPDNPAV